MNKKRPISPHLQVYKPQLTSVLSITHRLTGVGLSMGTLILCGWIFALSSGAETYSFFMTQIKSWYGQTFMVGMLFSFYYHLCNGLRHLYWDFGKGYSLKTVYKSGWIVVIASIFMTLMTVTRGV